LLTKIKFAYRKNLLTKFAYRHNLLTDFAYCQEKFAYDAATLPARMDHYDCQNSRIMQIGARLARKLNCP
jgi:hypothetical protein